MNIWLKCKENREMLGLTVEELAVFLGIDVNRYYEFEAGENSLSKQEMKRICESLYISKEDFELEKYDDNDMSEEEKRITEISYRVIKECDGE